MTLYSNDPRRSLRKDLDMCVELYTVADHLRELRVVSNQDGRLEVFGTSDDDRIWHTWQVDPGGNWNGG